MTAQIATTRLTPTQILHGRQSMTRTMSVMLVVLLPLFALGRTAHAESASITVKAAPNDWPRPCLLIPQLPAAPQIDGKVDADAWIGAAAGELRYPLGSNEPVEADTTFRVGHHDGVVYLLIRYDRSDSPTIVAGATKRDGLVWADDGGEVFFVPTHDLVNARQLMFNLRGTQADNAITATPGFGDDLVYDEKWDPDWRIATGRDGDVCIVEIAAGLREMLGQAGRIGETFRFDIVRNQVNGDPRIVHWTAIDGGTNCNPKHFGLAVLTGPAPSTLRWADLGADASPGVLFPPFDRGVRALTGSSVTQVLFNPLAGHAMPDKPLRTIATLSDAKGLGLARQEATIADWPQAFTIDPGEPRVGRYDFHVRVPDAPALSYRTSIDWQDVVRIEAEDPVSCPTTGRARTYGYPRSTGMIVRKLGEGARLSVTSYGRAAYLELPPLFLSPGPWYGSYTGAEMRWRIDDRAWQRIHVQTAARLIPLAEDLGPGEHRVEVESISDREPMLDAILFSTQPLAGIHGIITTNGYSETLTDVRAEVMAGDRIVQTRYVRNPINGRFVLLGLEPGTYRLRLVADAYKPFVTDSFTIERRGEKIDLGVIALDFDWDLRGWDRHVPRRGHTVSVQPGASFAMRVRTPNEPTSMKLISPYLTIDLPITAARRVREFGGYSPTTIWEIELGVPEGVPFDMYDLRCTCSIRERPFEDTWLQAVCVREPLPESFHLGGVGHMNTWGQQTADYLGKVAETIELAGARTMLVANEVNAPYIAGALRALRIPYLVTPGNHTMGRWDDFFGPRIAASDDGPMRFVTFGDRPSESWLEADALIGARPDATARVLVCYEGYAPAELIRQREVDLLFDGHSSGVHPDLPPRTFHMRPPDQQAVRWVPMDHRGVSPLAQSAKDVTSFRVPREGPSPLRIVFGSPNDGSADRMAATVINETDVTFPAARARFVMRGGMYTVRGAHVVQNFASDNGAARVIDVRFTSPAQGEVELTVEPVTSDATRSSE